MKVKAMMRFFLTQYTPNVESNNPESIGLLFPIFADDNDELTEISKKVGFFLNLHKSVPIVEQRSQFDILTAATLMEFNSDEDILIYDLPINGIEYTPDLFDIVKSVVDSNEFEKNVNLFISYTAMICGKILDTDQEGNGVFRLDEYVKYLKKVFNVIPKIKPVTEVFGKNKEHILHMN